MTDLSGQYLGRYYLVERLGEGGMAIVYKAYDTRLERDVAIKIIRSGAFPSDDLEQILKRFEREAKSLAKLSHPNIVKVYDYGEHEDSPYLVMEYLPGGTLKKLIGKPVPWQEAVRLILPVARGIAYAHQSGILHRDIKPANILITASGDPMLSDFGIAKLFEGDQTTALTGSGMAIGTPEYMAPEQWAGTTSPQSDLYSLGIVLYEMVTGRKPYIADTPGAILIKQITEPLPNPRKFVADVPEALEHALLKALAREPADRYKDIQAFIGALENLHVSTPAVLPTQETQEVEATYQVPAVKHEEPVPTEVVTRVGSETVQAVEPKKVEKLPPVKSRAVKTRPPVKFSRRGVGILIGGMVVFFALWLGSPWMGKLFTPASISTATSTPSVTPTKTLTPTPSLTPTETFTPTVAVTVTPYPTEISDIDPSGNPISMRLVPAGKFMMGSEKLDNEKPIHEVFLDAYYIDIYEVTNILYKACVTAGVCDKPKNTGSTIRSSYYGNSQFDDYPIIYVTWDMAKTYCKWREARLPTEAQWEKAARGTGERTYPWGEGIDCSKANYSGCVGDTTRVGNYEDGISPFGLYDMAGNVREWVSSAYKPYPYDATDGREDLTASRDLILRGGSWGDLNNEVRSAIRVGIIPSYTNEGVGFRCARSLP